MWWYLRLPTGKEKFINISAKLCCGNDNTSFSYFSKSNISQSREAHFTDTGISIVISSQPDSRQRHCCGVNTAQRCHLRLWQRVREATSCFALCVGSFRVSVNWRSGNQSSLSALFSIALQYDLEWPLCFVCLSSSCQDNASWLLINLFPGGRVYHLVYQGLPGRWPLDGPGGFEVLF